MPVPSIAPFTVLLATLLALSPPAGAQTAANTPEAADGDPRLEHIFRDREEVHVVQVEVVVTDRRGRTVAGLTAADFELWQDGEPVPVDHFYAVHQGRVVAAGETPEPAAAEQATDPPPVIEGHLVILVDEMHIQPAHRRGLLTRLRRQVADAWRPGLRAMVVRQTRRAVVVQPLTSDAGLVDAALRGLAEGSGPASRLPDQRNRLLAALESVNVEAGSGLVGTKAGMYGPGRLGSVAEDGDFDVDSQSEVTARVASRAKSLQPQLLAFAQEHHDAVVHSLTILRELVGTLAGLPGPKALVHVSDGLTLNPAEALFEAYDRHFELLSRVPGVTGLSREAGRFSLTEQVREVARQASLAGVRIYTVDAAPPALVQRGGADRSRALETAGFTRIEERNQEESLILLARETGGRAMLGGEDRERVLEGLVQDLENHYSLGFRAAPEPGRVRRLEVRLPDHPHLRAQAPTRVRDGTVHQRMARRTRAALVLGGGENPLEVAVETLAQEAEAEEGGTWVVPVRVTVPLRQLVLEPGPDEHQARLRLWLAVADERGDTSAVVEQVCPVRIPNRELLVALGRRAGCGVQLRMGGGEQRLVVGVRDELSSRESIAEATVSLGRVPEETARGDGDGAR